jgi:hypothetical protein
VQRAQFDGFNATTLRIIQVERPSAVNLDPRRTLYLH